MKTPHTDRRAFIKQSSLLTAGVLAGGPSMLNRSSTPKKNVIPKWKGFNLLDFFSPDPRRARQASKEEFFKWMADWGFDFVRLPMAYPSYIKFKRDQPLDPRRATKMDRRAVDKVEDLVYTANKYGLHVSINLHRAPGFCVNAGFEEPYNLWKDTEAQAAFYEHWRFWAKRFRKLSNDEISFDLLNEPCVREDMNDQHSKRSAIPGDLYHKVAKGAAEAIQSVKPNALIIADGNNVGRDVTPELIDLGLAQSCRGYHPGIISHYKASWAFKDIDNLPEPKWPGQVGKQHLSRKMLEDFYQPWIELAGKGIGVHCGECGCYNKTPHAVFLAWFEDVLDILTSHGIGFALWEFKGTFGILNSGRKDVDYENWYGYQLDRKLLNLMMKY